MVFLLGVFVGIILDVSTSHSELKKERDFWELEAKRYCSALGEQKIKLQKLKCEMCKDIGKCEKC